MSDKAKELQDKYRDEEGQSVILNILQPQVAVVVRQIPVVLDLRLCQQKSVNQI